MVAIGYTDNEVSEDQHRHRSSFIVHHSLQVHLLDFPSLSPVSKSVKLEGELFDATFGSATVSLACTVSATCLPPQQLVVVSSTRIAVYTIPGLSSEPTCNGASGQLTHSKSDKGTAKVAADNVPLPPLELVKILEKPRLPNLAQGSTVSFRAARYSLRHVS